MLVPLDRLLRRLRQPRTRADELVALDRRLRAARTTAVTAEERALAAEVSARKHELARVLGEVTSCATCAKGHPAPRGLHDGGACCAGDTPALFDDHELAALALAGTRPLDLTAPRSAEPHAGCAFRGALGCSLALAHRPGRCVHYLCDDLRRELHRHARLDAVEEAQAALDQAMRRFVAARTARLDREAAAPLAAALEAAARAATRR